MNNVNIMDASAILAFLQSEKGHEVVESALASAESRIATVNYCEVLSKLCEKGMPRKEAESALDEVGLKIVDFDVEMAQEAAALRVKTMPIGASLGDRSCLALAHRAAITAFAPTVYTAETSWTKLKWPFKIILIRSVTSKR